MLRNLYQALVNCDIDFDIDTIEKAIQHMITHMPSLRWLSVSRRGQDCLAGGARQTVQAKDPPRQARARLLSHRRVKRVKFVVANGFMNYIVTVKGVKIVVF